jgi:hypothetical protein
LASICVRLASKMRTSMTSKPFVCNKTLSSFRQNNIFFAFPPLSSPARLIPDFLAALPCKVFHTPPVTTIIGYHKPVLVSRKKWRRQRGRYQASGAGSRGAWESKESSWAAPVILGNARSFGPLRPSPSQNNAIFLAIVVYSIPKVYITLNGEQRGDRNVLVVTLRPSSGSRAATLCPPSPARLALEVSQLAQSAFETI